MNWEQKLQAIKSLDSSINPIMRRPGDWYCSIPGELCGDGLARSAFGNGKTPKEAVEKAWDIIESIPNDLYLRIPGGKYRWNGYMFSMVSNGHSA